jgi:hypothetical protein
MSEKPETGNAGTVWRNQPKEDLAVNLELILDRRAREFRMSTRWEILMSVAATVLLAAVMLLRMAPSPDAVLDAALAAAGAWAMLTLYLFRRRIWGRESGRADAAAATGVEFYRRQLACRRDHLKNAWLWHGPLFLAVLALVAVVRRSYFGDRLVSVIPLLVLLAAWIVFGIVHRLRQARELQREIDELDRRQS